MNRASVAVRSFPGLTSREAAARLLKYGENSIYRAQHMLPLIAFIKKFNSPLLLMLIGTSILSFFLGQSTNAIIILLMVLVSAVLDFINTSKSAQVAKKLVAQVASTATVWRDGKKHEIKLSLLVPGDIIELTAGDVVPADCRVLAADDFFVNQSSLTGESFPVEKQIDTVKGIALLAKGEKLPLSSESAVFMGTSVVTGYASAVVLHTGPAAEFGRIAERLSAAEEENDFERGIRSFSVFIMRLTFVMVTVVFAINAATGHGILTSLLFSIAIAVGLTPELLPVIMSVSLARGSLVMAKKQVIVKNLSAIQNFGGMNILCTDKTGTLTEDRITLVKCVDRTGKDSLEVMTNAYLSSVMHTARRSPLDAAIEQHGKLDVSGYKKVDEVPFDFHRRRDSVITDLADKRYLVAKGAPESILSVCDTYHDEKGAVALTDALRSAALKEFDDLSADGYRVLAIARKTITQEKRIVYSKDEEIGLTFLGFAAFLDPPKQSSAAALLDLKALHVDVKILTGDSEKLTERICKDIGLPIHGILTGDQITELSDSQLARKVGETNIFARVSPEQKERIVAVLRKEGNAVGYMGDGINDAPVLKAADVGISVNNAVDVAKETADIILLTKSLDVLKDGIIEGRKTFQNTLKYIKMGFSSNFGNMFSMMGASAFLPFLPMLPSQILFNNFLYDLSQMTLSTDVTDVEDTKKPLRWDMHYFSRYVAVFGLVSSVFDFITFFTLYKIFSLSATGFQSGWFIESIATQVLIVFIIRTKRVPFFRSMPSWPVIVSTLTIVVIAWVTPFTPLGKILSFGQLSVPIMIAIAGIVAVYLVLGEMTKSVFYRLYPKAP